MSWTEGYVNEVGYTYGYYRELSPVFLEFSLINQRQLSRSGGPVRYLELGFGQGLSLNIHAAAIEGEFWGADFNPAHAAYAAELARAGRTGARILEDSFAELAARPDLPEFDIIALHGVWSWISEANRRIIVDIARRKLAPGGLFFLSYNACPGRTEIMPLRRLMAVHAELTARSTSDLVGRINGAVAFAQTVHDVGATYFKAHPGVAEWLKMLKGQEGSYLAHEYFNADWQPMAFDEVARELAPAKLDFAASAYLPDHLEEFNLSAEQLALLAQISHPVLRQTVRDFCINQSFRRDIWVKGARPLSPARQTACRKSTRFILTVPPDAVSFSFQGMLLEANLNPGMFRPVLEGLAGNDYAPKTAAELSDLVPGMEFSQLMQALTMFVSNGVIAPAQSEAAVAAARPRTETFNAHLLERAVSGSELVFLASPVTGGGVLLSRFEQLFLRAFKRGYTLPEEWAQETWRILEQEGVCLVRDGRNLNSAQENLSELVRRAYDFAAKRLTILKAAGIA